MGIFGFVPGAEAIIPHAAKAVEFARQQRFQIIHVGLGFAAGHPEISDVESPFARVKQNNLFVKGTPSAGIHSALHASAIAG
jgi:nicotinamidase-related amidase